MTQISMVDYLVLGDDPHLEALMCVSCGARFFDRRNACAACEGTEFTRVEIPRFGTIKTYTIVTMARPGIPVPFVAAVVDCGGTAVKTNIINIKPDPKHIQLGMNVRLTTYSLGADPAGTEAVNFGFEPISNGGIDG